MPKQRYRQPPTPWQIAKPVILAIFTPAFLRRGFANPGMMMWRRRHEFVDVVDLRSKYGTECYAYFGCHPAALGAFEGQAGVSRCMFRTTAQRDFRIPPDVTAMTSFVERELLPAVTHVVDTWFAQFTSLEAAASFLENRTVEVCLFNKHSPAYEEALASLNDCIRQRASRDGQ